MDIINKYNEIINILMKNDKNAMWDEILGEMQERYTSKNEILKYSILELCESLEIALESCDEELNRFYSEQYEKSKKLIYYI